MTPCLLWVCFKRKHLLHREANKFFPFKIESFPEGRQSSLYRIASPVKCIPSPYNKTLTARDTNTCHAEYIKMLHPLLSLIQVVDANPHT